MQHPPTLAQADQSQSLARISPKAVREKEILEVTPQEVPHLLAYWRVIIGRRWAVLSPLLIGFSQGLLAR